VRETCLQAAPSFLAVTLLTIAPMVICLFVTFHYFIAFALQRIVLPMSRQAGVYAMSVMACEALSEKEWEKLQASTVERPDIKSQVANGEWITDDIQVILKLLTLCTPALWIVRVCAFTRGIHYTSTELGNFPT
jgi:hypothetical protein